MAKKFLTPIDMAGNTINNLRVENLAALPASGNGGRVVFNTTNGTLNFDTGSGWIAVADANAAGAGDMTTGTYDSNSDGKVDAADAADAVPWTGVTGKPTTFAPSAHTHVSADITDLQASIDTRVAAYWASIAGGDADVDTIREVMDLVIANASALQAAIKRFNLTFGDGSATSFTVTHNMGTTDVQVEVYEIATGQTVVCEVTRTSANVVTIAADPAPAANALRAVVRY